jgi:hypothetical protein
MEFVEEPCVEPGGAPGEVGDCDGSGLGIEIAVFGPVAVAVGAVSVCFAVVGAGCPT